MTTIDPRTLDTCTYCPRLCRHACPTAMGEARETLIPTHKMALLQMWQKGQLSPNEELADIAHACTDCGACTAACKPKMEPARALYQARTEMFVHRLLPAPLQDVLKRCEGQGSPYPEPPHSSLQALVDPKAPIQLLAGCATCSLQAPQITLWIDAITAATKQKVGLVPPQQCCGMPRYALGDQHGHQTQVQGLAQSLRMTTTVIIADPYCQDHVQRQYQYVKQQLRIPVRSLFDLLFDALPARSAAAHGPVFYHDSSAIGRFGGEYERPRQALLRLGYEVVEFSRHHFQSAASGAGGVYRWHAPHGAQNNAKRILAEVFRHQEREGREQAIPVVTVGETERSLFAEAEPTLRILDLLTLMCEATQET